MSEKYAFRTISINKSQLDFLQCIAMNWSEHAKMSDNNNNKIMLISRA